MYKIFLGLISLLLFVSTQAHAETVLLTWDDNPAAEEITNYNVYKNDALIASPIESEYELVLFDAVDACFSVSALNLVGESIKSDPVCTPIIATQPSNPKFISIHIVIN